MESGIQYQPARRHQRFKALHRALVLIDTGPESLPYHIMDISENGLSFRYLGQKLKRPDIKEVSLYHDHEMIVEKIPVQTVSDQRLHDNLIPVRRRSIQFTNINEAQRSQLERFIQNYTDASQSAVA